MLENQKPLIASVDAAGTLKNLDHIFTSSASCITELMQNSRRAGATSLSVTLVHSEPEIEPIDYRWTEESKCTKISSNIESIIIEDNGSGIEDFDKLFKLSKSGWSNEIQEAERSFGVGFFSVLFYAETVSVESKGIKHSFSKEDILHGKGSTFSKSDVIDGTKITLTNVKNKSTENFIFSLRRNCRSYPLKVTLNAEIFSNEYQDQHKDVLSRKTVINEVLEADLLPACLDQNSDYIKVDFEYGFTYIPKDRAITNKGYLNIEDLSFLQSLPIDVSDNYHHNRKKFTLGESVISFLHDSVPATHPDRNSVHGDVKGLVSSSLKDIVVKTSCDLFKNKIHNALKAEATEKYMFFTKNHELLMQPEFIEFYSDFNALLAIDFAQVEDRICINTESFMHEYFGYNSIDVAHNVVTEEWVHENAPIFITFEEEVSQLANASYILAKELEKQGQNVFLISKSLTNAQNTPDWICCNTLDLELCDIEIKTIGESHTQDYEQNDIWIPTVFCDKMSISIKPKDDHNKAFMQTHENFVFSYVGSNYYATTGEAGYDVSLIVPYANKESISLYDIIIRKDEWANNISFIDDDESGFDQFLSVNRKADSKEALKVALEQFLDGLSNTRLSDTLKSVNIEICQGKAAIA